VQSAVAKPYSTFAPSSTSHTRFAGLQQHFAIGSTQIQSSSTTMSRDDSMAMLVHTIKFLAAYGLIAAFTHITVGVLFHLFGCSYKVLLVGLPVALLWSSAIARAFKV
jgi:hypothetical protein